MLRIFLKLFLFYFLLLTGCNSNKLIKYEENTACKATIEGNFYTPPIYKYYSPVILFKKGSMPNYKMGSVVKSDSAGIYLAEKKVGLLHNPDTIYFEYSQLRAIVDDNKFCVWGKLDANEIDSKQIKIVLYKIDSPDYKPIYLELTPNSSFSYCALPGEYIITRIVEGNENDSFKETVPLTLFKFHVENNSANYIGDIYFVGNNDFNDSTLSIPYRKQTKNILIGGGNAYFDAIGLLVYGAVALSNSYNINHWSSCYNINIKNDYRYKSSTNLKLISTHLDTFINYEK
ncbi:MAG: hypothetical protein Q8N83_09320 [Ignavibacteria bacterium]|nr:hypothetical protein [Ignavibacteria bacterium]